MYFNVRQSNLDPLIFNIVQHVNYSATLPPIVFSQSPTISQAGHESHIIQGMHMYNDMLTSSTLTKTVEN